MEGTGSDGSPVAAERDGYVAARIERHPVLGDVPEAKSVPFTLDGRMLHGHEGEPVLAALLANGVRVCRTMPNSGEARGGYCLVGRCSDCLMVVNAVPGVQTCVTPLAEGMAVATQHGLGSWGAEAPGSGAGE